MEIETTLNVRNDFLERITLVARSLGIHRTELIIQLFKMVMNEEPKYIRHGKRIQYQSRNKHVKWHAFHIKLRPNDYECLLDLRKILKMSVSHILAYTINKYLDLLLKKRTADNYHFTNYLMLKETIDGITCWKLFWGFPRNLNKLIHDY